MSSKFDALFEDEDDIFSGTPQSKFWDFFNKLSPDLAENEMDKIIEKIAAMEAMLEESIHEEELNKKIKQYALYNAEEMHMRKKSLYMEFAGEMLFQFDS